MLRFNLETIKRKCKYDMYSVYRVLCVAEGVRSKEGSITKEELIWGTGLIRGDSYILNLTGLLTDQQSSIEEKMQYIELASKRNFFDFRYHGDKTLNASLVKRQTIQHNRLLKVTNNKIHFKFEENNKWQ